MAPFFIRLIALNEWMPRSSVAVAYFIYKVSYDLFN